MSRAWYFQVEWDDGTVDASRDLLLTDGDPALNTATHTHLVTLTHIQGYRHGDDFNVTVRVENTLSAMTLHYNHSVYEEIVALDFHMLWHDGVREVAGFGHESSVYRQAEPVLFRSTYERGSHMTFTWDYGDGITESFYENPNASHVYAEPGNYNVTLVASNFLDSANLTYRIRVQREISSALSMYTVTPIVANATYDFNISFANMSLGDWGTAPCYRLNFDGDENTTTHLLFFGNLTQCEEFYPDEYVIVDPEYVVEHMALDDSYLEALFDGDTWLNLTVQNYYGSVSQYFVTLTGKNIVSERTVVFRFVTTAGPCFNPLVELEPVNQCTPGFNCHVTRNIPEFFRSDTILLSSYVIFDCFTSQVCTDISTVLHCFVHNQIPELQRSISNHCNTVSTHRCSNIMPRFLGSISVTCGVASAVGSCGTRRWWTRRRARRVLSICRCRTTPSRA